MSTTGKVDVIGQAPLHYTLTETGVSTVVVGGYDVYKKVELQSPQELKRLGIHASTAYTAGTAVQLANQTIGNNAWSQASRIMALPVACGGLSALGQWVLAIGESPIMNFLVSGGACLGSALILRRET